MKFLIVGGTGLIGKKLCTHFIMHGHDVDVLTRLLNTQGASQAGVQYMAELKSEIGHYDIVINLAGEPLNKKRWNSTVKNNIVQSRLQTTQKIIDHIARSHTPPKLLISGSAIGYYGSSERQRFTENTEPADKGFTHQLCNDWENIAFQASKYGTRVCQIRTGIVLAQSGGALQEMLTPFKFGLGAQLGNGLQWMSWIHIDDVVGAIDFLVQHPDMIGAVNLSAPYAVSNKTFTQTLSSIIHRPCLLKMPDFMVRLMFGEMGDALLLKGQNVYPEKLILAGFQFKYPDLSSALNAIFKNHNHEK